MNALWKSLAGLAALAAVGVIGAPASAQTVTVYHDKPFYQAGWDGLTVAAKKDSIDLKFVAYATDQFQAFVQSSLMAGNAPDAMTWWNGTKLQEIVASGQIAPLDDLWKKKIAEGEYDAASADAFTVNGHIYGMPVGYNHWIVLYDKALFRKAGLAGPPKTWAEMMDDCEKLKTAGITPFDATVQDGWRGFIWFEELMIRTNPDAYIALNKGKLKYTDEPVRAAFKLWTDMYAKGYFTPAESQEEVLDFARGKAAMYLAGDWAIGLVQQGGLKAGIDFDGFIMPSVDPAAPHVVIIEASPLLITKAGAEKPEIMKFADWFMSEDAMNAWATTPGNYAGNLKAKTPNPIIAEIGQIVKDGNYHGITRYWEASPSEIVLPVVEELNHFMVSPSPKAADRAMKNSEAIAAQYWAAHP